jgi:hypothetical protein
MSAIYSINIKIKSKVNKNKITRFLEENNYEYMQEEGLFNFRKENNEEINPDFETALKIIEQDGGGITFCNKNQGYLEILFHTNSEISIIPRVTKYLDNPKNRIFLRKFVNYIKKHEQVTEVKEFFDTQECNEIFKPKTKI